jgi:hypothetical protein
LALRCFGRQTSIWDVCCGSAEGLHSEELKDVQLFSFVSAAALFAQDRPIVLKTFDHV